MAAAILAGSPATGQGYVPTRRGPACTRAGGGAGGGWPWRAAEVAGSPYKRGGVGGIVEACILTYRHIEL
ncbi:MAG: hypothetical protein ACYDHX_16470 [Methanothrix sp.]